MKALAAEVRVKELLYPGANNIKYFFLFQNIPFLLL